MKKYILIAIVVILIAPIIPYENQLQEGVTVIEHKSIGQWVYKRYTEVQAAKVEKESPSNEETM